MKTLIALLILLNLSTNNQQPTTIKLKSSAFKEGEMIPKKFACQGEDVSPQLSWDKLPTDTKSIAVTCDDPDAPGGGFVHWVIFNIPANAISLPENIAKQKTLPDGSRQGINDFGRIGYGGPCPPALHRYYFRVYVLDIVLDLQPGIEKPALLKAIEGHIIAQGEIIGKYKKY